MGLPQAINNNSFCGAAFSAMILIGVLENLRDT